jgi:hypothetical protein
MVPEQGTPVWKTGSEGVDMVCWPKARRLAEFYREQTARQLTAGSSEDVPASDLTTKSQHSPARITRLNSSRSPPECRELTTSPLTVSLQQKLKTFSDLSSPKLLVSGETLSHNENVKDNDKTELRADCDNEVDGAETKTERVGPLSADDTQKDHKVSGAQGGRKEKGVGCVQENCEVQVLLDTGRTAISKNDNNNNNNKSDGELKTSCEVLRAGNVSLFWVRTP